MTQSLFRSNSVDLDQIFFSRDLTTLNSYSALYVTGTDQSGALGLGTFSSQNRSVPTVVGSLSNSATWRKVASGYFYSLAVKTDGTLWAWGHNDRGQLGLGDRNHRSSPVQVGTLTNWSSVYVPQSDAQDGTNAQKSYAIKTDGTLWAWGHNGNGTLGLNDTTHRSSPVQVGALTNWREVAAGRSHALAIKTDGTLWSWGINRLGELGQGNTTDRQSPVQVGTLNTWSSIAVGSSYNTVSGFTTGHSLATRTDGTMWSWGNNSWGALGHGNNTHRSSPVQITSPSLFTGWKSVAGGDECSLALSNDGVIYGWGFLNSSGSSYWTVSGQTDTLITNGSSGRSPVPLYSQSTAVEKISAYGIDNGAAILKNGRAIVWGTRSVGQLGDGTTSSVNVSINLNRRINLPDTIKEISVGRRFVSFIARLY